VARTSFCKIFYPFLNLLIAVILLVSLIICYILAGLSRLMGNNQGNRIKQKQS
jgi:NADH:ubiquinone oxidoreductase subunit 3 (subunit A)